MDADIEALILSGKFFNPDRSTSPTRSASTGSEPDLDDDKGWHDDEVEFARPDQHEDEGEYGEGIGMGVTGRTGVKGVIRDRDEAVSIEKQKKEREMTALNERMEKSNLGGRTYLEEEREKARRGDEKVDRLVLDEIQREEERTRRDMLGRRKEGRFGHLREVGVKGFVPAVEKEERGIWVVVHLYEPTLERCFHLDETLAHLARTFPDTKFVRCRASVLGFASKSSNASSRPAGSSITRNYGDDEDEDEDDERDEDVDTDMLPTMLVYRNGELVYNWVRVDWEAGDAGVEELLERHHILPRTRSALDDANDKDFDDDDLVWSDED